MTDEKHQQINSSTARIVSLIFGLPLIEILSEVWKIGKKGFRGFANEGMYEILDEETTLVVHDEKGKSATVSKYLKIRYVQDYITTFPLPMWGDGVFPIDFEVSPGVKGDQYKRGHKTIVNVSLRQEKDKGSIDEIDASWKIRDGFSRNTESWTTGIRHKHKHAKVRILLPKQRPPKSVILVEHRRRRTSSLDQHSVKQLRNGTWEIKWEKGKPKRNEEYMIEWKW